MFNHKSREGEFHIGSRLGIEFGSSDCQAIAFGYCSSFFYVFNFNDIILKLKCIILKLKLKLKQIFKYVIDHKKES